MTDDCRLIEPLLAAYALDSLDGEQRELVNAHLPGCADCNALLADYQAIIGELALTVPEADPPAELRRTLSQAIAEPEGSVADSPPGKRFSPWRWAAGAAIAAILVANLLLVQQVIALRADQARLQQELGAGQIAQAIASYPGATSLLIDEQDVYGTLVYDPDRPVAAMYTWGLQPLAAGQTYQVWLREGGEGRVSGGTFNPVTDKAFTLVVIRAPGPIHDYSGVGVTVEPAGGSQAPTGPNVLGVDF
jgi:anti-sigma-K factor RskA